MVNRSEQKVRLEPVTAQLGIVSPEFSVMHNKDKYRE